MDPEFGDSNFEVQHRLSCEHKVEKRNFIQTMVSPKFLGGAAAELALDRATNYMTEEAEEVPEVDFVVAGFPCKDVSRLNAAARENATVVRDQDGREREGERDI